VPDPLRHAGLVFAALALACDPDPGRAARRDSTVLAEREARLTEAAAKADPGSGEPLAKWELPLPLREISGLALDREGRLFAHNDSDGIIYQIDYRRGVIVKQFQLGETPIQGDFEAIAVAGERMYLLTSDGILYRFPEGDDRARVAYNEIDTGLGKHCEFEGMTYDAAANALILACKTIYEKSLEHQVVLYRWSLPSGEPVTRLAVSEAAIDGKPDEKGEIRPTDIAIDPASGSYVLLTMKGQLVRVSPEGALMAIHRLPDRHQQPEGLAVTPDGFLLISDEAGPRPASITAYRGFPTAAGK
jgi:hypothetical protein